VLQARANSLGQVFLHHGHLEGGPFCGIRT
jgi:hypothetical protein